MHTPCSQELEHGGRLGSSSQALLAEHQEEDIYDYDEFDEQEEIEQFYMSSAAGQLCGWPHMLQPLQAASKLRAVDSQAVHASPLETGGGVRTVK
jgi:hypothetical protein